MNFFDPIYGTIQITDPLALDIINTKTFQRLKDITQSGMPEIWSKDKVFTRFEHSIGVYYLLQHYKASRREQIGGLLHDISHRAFSHLYEWLIDDTQSHIENLSEKETDLFLQDKELLNIWTKHNFTPLRYKDFKTFQMLDQDIPNLSVDRFDYSFRENKIYTKSLELFDKCFTSNTWDLKHNSFFFQNYETALFYANCFLYMQENEWDSWNSTFRYETMTRLFKLAFSKGILSLSDFDFGEKQIIEKIYQNKNDKDIAKYLELLEKKVLDKANVYGINKRKKFRYVDPYFLQNGNLIRLSEYSEEFKNKLTIAKVKNQEGKNL